MKFWLWILLVKKMKLNKFFKKNYKKENKILINMKKH